MSEPLLRRTAGVVSLDVDAEIVLWHDTVLHRLNPMAAQVWTELAVPTTASQLETAVASTWHQSAADATSALRALLEQLTSAGLVQVFE